MIILKMKNVAIRINKKAEKISVLSSGKINKYDYLTDEEYCFQSEQIREKNKFNCSSLGKVLKKETEKQVDAIKLLDFSNKISELNQLKSIFLQNQLNYLIIERLIEINQLENNK